MGNFLGVGDGGAEGTDPADSVQVETALVDSVLVDNVLVGIDQVGIDQADRIQEGMEYARSGNESLGADGGAVEDCDLEVGTVDCTQDVGNLDHRDSDGHK